MSFEALQRRAAARARGAAALAARWPAFFVAFDVLQRDGEELLDRPYAERRTRLVGLFAEHVLTAPWTLVPMTTDLGEAREWLESWTDVSGSKAWWSRGCRRGTCPDTGAGPRSKGGTARRRSSAPSPAPLTRPQLLILGRHDEHGRLRAVGRTVALRQDQARQAGEHLTAAGAGHPWAGVRFASAWGSRDVLDAVLVRPEVVAEISADRAIDHGGVYRHPFRFRRLRQDMTVDDVPPFGRGGTVAAG
ncbi:ATP-dependent DNA ligase [Streptomyces sp. WAC07061]|uniref:ATP-dependent DNA ligase n=1 Tax=Streptomyces sp. WAC07061 TaxID=2487410 RepID=UPI0021AF8A0E|nr:ATP-dependent DNA ligase [Streptomyces sp. WAC07061]